MRIEVLAWRSPWVLFVEMVEDPTASRRMVKPDLVNQGSPVVL